MTTEQNAQWRDAIFLAYGISEPWSTHRAAEATLLALMPRTERIAFLLDRLKESAERLTHRDIPGWVLEMRGNCLVKGWSVEAPGLHEFVLSSEVALVGMTFLFPTQEARVAAYRRLLQRLFHHGLLPVVDWIERHGDAVKPTYIDEERGVIQDSDESARRTFRALVDFYEVIHDPSAPPSREEIEARLDARSRYTHRLTEIVYTILFKEPEFWWNIRGLHLADDFFEIHQWPARWKTEQFVPVRPTDPIHVQAVAAACLQALEEECPPPDWRPELL